MVVVFNEAWSWECLLKRKSISLINCSLFSVFEAPFIKMTLVWFGAERIVHCVGGFIGSVNAFIHAINAIEHFCVLALLYFSSIFRLMCRHKINWKFAKVMECDWSINFNFTTCCSWLVQYMLRLRLHVDDGNTDTTFTQSFVALFSRVFERILNSEFPERMRHHRHHRHTNHLYLHGIFFTSSPFLQSHLAFETSPMIRWPFGDLRWFGKLSGQANGE